MKTGGTPEKPLIALEPAMPAKHDVEWFDMDESTYRASRVCRVMGNPKAYQILMVLRELGEATPSVIQTRINRSMATTCVTLKTLREVDLVRYQRKGKNAIYTIKNRQVEIMMDSNAAFVEQVRRQAK